MNDLLSACEDCKACRLYSTRNHLVFGTGNPHADVFLIGEGPGENEDREGLPFVGRSGKLLDECLAQYRLSREENLYIANMVKCRPPENRNPRADEVEACIGYLLQQIELVDPKVVVCLGRVAASYFLGKDFKVTKQHGEFFEKDGRLFTATFHPAAILRNINQKPVFEEDLRIISEFVK